MIIVENGLINYYCDHCGKIVNRYMMARYKDRFIILCSDRCVMFEVLKGAEIKHELSKM